MSTRIRPSPALASPVTARVALADILRELLNYLGSLVDARSKEPKDDLISKLCVEQLSKGTLTKADAVQVAFLLLVAGNATMVNMINLVSFPGTTTAAPLQLLVERNKVTNRM